jgi:hypothetical protein
VISQEDRFIEDFMDLVREGVQMTSPEDRFIEDFMDLVRLYDVSGFVLAFEIKDRPKETRSTSMGTYKNKLLRAVDKVAMGARRRP